MVKWLLMKWVEVALRGRNRVDSLGKGLGRLLVEGVEWLSEDWVDFRGKRAGWLQE